MRAEVRAFHAPEVEDDLLQDDARVADADAQRVASRLVDVERRFVDGAVAQHAFEPHLRVFDVRRGGGGQCPVVDLDAVLGVGVRVFADAEIAVGVEREGRQHVGVDIDRTGVEGVEVVFGARDVAAAEDLERGGRVAQLQRGAFDAEVFDGCYFDSVVFTDAVAACGGDRDAAVVLDVDAAELGPCLLYTSPSPRDS